MAAKSGAHRAAHKTHNPTQGRAPKHTLETHPTPPSTPLPLPHTTHAMANWSAHTCRTPLRSSDRSWRCCSPRRNRMAALTHNTTPHPHITYMAPVCMTQGEGRLGVGGARVRGLTGPFATNNTRTATGNRRAYPRRSWTCRCRCAQLTCITCMDVHTEARQQSDMRNHQGAEEGRGGGWLARGLHGCNFLPPPPTNDIVASMEVGDHRGVPVGLEPTDGNFLDVHGSCRG